MSIDLDVKITRDVEIRHLMVNCQNELVKLCKFKEIPQLEIYQLKNGLVSEMVNEHYITPRESFIITFNNIKQEINLTITEMKLQLPYVDEDEAGIWGGISIQGEDECKYLLAAGVALYLSNHCKSNVIDERCIWTTNRECTYERFFDSLELKSNISNVDFNILCHEFFTTLPKKE